MSGSSKAQASLPANAASTPALLGGGLPGAAGPVTGVSTINHRLPSAQLAPAPAQQMALPGMQSADDDDSDDEPGAKKPRLDDGSLIPENKWIEKHPMPIQILVQVNLGSDALAANIPTVIPLEL